jgi:Cysteine-rich secretory protein family
MVANSRRPVANKKRHGKHQNQSKDFLKVYWPYVPLLIIVSLGMLVGIFYRPISHRGVLAYATSMSREGLLSATNQQRAANGVGSLGLNSALNQAAQAKANDMVARDYWSHNTPEGNPPWVFIDNAGYAYKKAGENLAYGFTTSSDTVVGWMNSPSHKENMLGGDYTDVGFGYANSPDYQGTGPETVVVAMYGQPMVAAASSPPAPAPTPQPVVQSNKKSTSAPAPAAAAQPAPEPTPQQEPTPTPSEVATASPQPTTTETPIDSDDNPVAVSRLATITGGQLAWLSGVASGLIIASVLALAIKHGLGIRKWLVKGERFILHHMLFDVTVISLIGLCVMVSQTAGFVL